MATIEIVIPVHTVQRPLARAVTSCFDGNGDTDIRVTVVCHNVAAQDIQEAAGLGEDSRVRFLELRDGVNSPAGPLNFGIKAADADYVGVMGSDDFLEPGTLALWNRVLERTGAEILIAPLKHQDGTPIRTPRLRPGRTSSLDPVRDRLAYATAPLGLWSTALTRSLNVAFAEGLRTGEDLETGLRLWFAGVRIERPKRGHYVIGADATDRVTSSVLPLAQEFEAVFRLDQHWLAELSPAERTAIAVKLARIHFLAALLRRGSSFQWSPEDLAAATEFVGRLDALSPRYRRALTREDVRLLDLMSAPGLNAEALNQALKRYESAGRWSRTLTQGVLGNLNPESTLRHLIRQKLYRKD